MIDISAVNFFCCLDAVGLATGRQLSSTNLLWLSQKKHSPTHTNEEEEEGFAQTAKSIAWDLIPFTVL